MRYVCVYVYTHTHWNIYKNEVCVYIYRVGQKVRLGFSL